jgi:hypothetical protein
MKVLLTIAILLYHVTLLSGQEFINAKYDMIWVLGRYGLHTNSQIHGGISVDFNQSPPYIYQVERDFEIDFTNASVCDHEGNLMFFTNGFKVMNFANEIIENGDTILLDFDNYLLNSSEAMRMRQGAIILPRPASDHLYDIFHEEYSINSSTGATVVNRCMHTVVDMAENDGLGRVIEKSTVIVEDTLDWGLLSATRHANGRDWWLLVPKYGANVFFRFLLTPEGVVPMTYQSFGTAVPYAGTGQNVFSPDGSRYTRVKYGYMPDTWEVSIYEFDRCTGLLTSEYVFQHPGSGLNYPAGGVFSPNGRFFYLSEDRQLWQYDMESPDIQDFKILIAEWDGSQTIFPTVFAMGQIAPDGKIYLSSGNTNSTLNLITYPNKYGFESDPIINGVELPSSNNTLPNFPNFRLGPLDGSECDTLGIDNPVVLTGFGSAATYSLTLFPNPAGENLVVTLPEGSPGDSELELFSCTGVQACHWLLTPGVNNVSVSALYPGIYFYRIKQGTQESAGKIIKL